MPARDRLLQLRLSLVLALCLLGAALAPAVSRALAASTGLPAWALSAVCRSPASPAGSSEPGAPASLHDSACALCQQARDLPLLALAPAEAWAAAPAPRAILAAPARPGAPRAPPAWQQPPRQAPPAPRA